MEKEIYLYPYSAAEARTRNELALWRASYQANEECARDIEEHIRTHFDGAHLDDSMLQPLLDKWGYKRINFVLANTLQELSYDGRFSRKNQEWAKATFIPQDGTHNISLMVKSHPAVLDGFVNMVREAYKNLGLFGPQHCEPNSFENLDYEGRVLVLSPDTLKESAGRPKTSFGWPMMDLAARPTPLGALSDPPVLEMENRHGGIAPTSSGCCGRSFSRTGPKRNWLSYRQNSPIWG